jgi:hypothetical protein
LGLPFVLGRALWQWGWFPCKFGRTNKFPKIIDEKTGAGWKNNSAALDERNTLQSFGEVSIIYTKRKKKKR